ncbi:MAG: glycoside hydrolase [Methylococcaceae bacterium]|nr:glycoside hydrolase [Methylococcaceae bacterium]
MMKPTTAFLLLALLTLTGCVTGTDIKSADNAKPMHQHGQPPAKKAICANPAAAPSSLCSETATAAFDSNGVLWVTWVNNDYLYVQSSPDKGLTFSAPVKVNAVAESIAAKGESRPKIKLDKNDVIYLTWDLTLDKKRNTHIRFSRSTDGGQHFSKPVTVNDNLEIIRHRLGSMAIGKNGEIFIAWQDERDIESAKKAGKEFKGLSLYYSWSDDGGKHFHPNKSIADHVCECCRIDTAIAQDNTPVIAWRHIFEGEIRDHAIVKFKNWNTPGQFTRLSHENWKIDACPHHGPGLYISDTDVYHAVWFSNADTKQGLFYAYSTNSGQSFSEPVNFGNVGASHPHVLGLGRQVAVVWQEFDGKNNNIQVMKSADEGKSWSKPEVIAQSTEMIDEPFLVGDGQAIYLSWQSLQQGYQLKRL